MGLKQLIVLTQGATSSASSQHASCLPTEQSATEPGTGSARWELRDNLWGLDPSPAHMDICLVTVFNGPALRRAFLHLDHSHGSTISGSRFRERWPALPSPSQREVEAT